MSEVHDILSRFKLANGFVTGGDDAPPVLRLPTGSPSLDRALGGGIPKGMITTVVGEPSMGKTTLCISTAIQAQRAGKHVIWHDTEYKMNGDHAIRQGFNPDLASIIRSTSIEEASDMMIEVLSKKGDDVGLIVWDSIAQSFSMRSMAKTNAEGAMASSEAGAFSRSWPRLQSMLYAKGVPMLCTNQFRIKGIGGSFTWKDQYGGGIIRYAPAVIIWFTGFDKVVRGDIPRGQQTAFKIQKSQTSTPFLEGKFEIDYDEETGWYGISFVGDLAIMGLDAGVIKKSGAWYSFEDVKGQGVSNFKNEMMARPDLVEKLRLLLIPDIEYASISD